MDPRQRRSRERLHEAVLALASERRIEQVTVTEVAERAGVNRSTFYEHAVSPSALLVDALRGGLDEARAAHLSDVADLPVALRDVTRAVLVHIRDHAAVYRRGLTPSGALRDFLGEHFLESGRSIGLTESELAARYIADGTVGAIAAWVERDELDVDEFLADYAAMVPGWWPRSEAPSGRG